MWELGRRYTRRPGQAVSGKWSSAHCGCARNSKSGHDRGLGWLVGWFCFGGRGVVARSCSLSREATQRFQGGNDCDIKEVSRNSESQKKETARQQCQRVGFDKQEETEKDCASNQKAR